MKKGQEGSGDLTKKEPIEFRGMGEGAIEALVGKKGLIKLKQQMKEVDARYKKAKEGASE